MPQQINNAILIYENKGKACYRFCQSQEGQEVLDKALVNGSGGSLIMFDEPALEAEFLFKMASVRGRVEEAVTKLQRDLNARDAMDEAGVPKDVELRKLVFKAMDIHLAKRLSDALLKL